MEKDRDFVSEKLPLTFSPRAFTSVKLDSSLGFKPVFTTIDYQMLFKQSYF